MQFCELGDERYINVATFRRDGREVRTPVWAARDGDRIIVWTNVNSGKIKRIRHTPQVRVAACDVRGAVRGDWHDGRARILEDEEERDAALDFIFRKYGWLMYVSSFAARIGGRWRERAALEIRAPE